MAVDVPPAAAPEGSPSTTPLQREELARVLEELIEALDRRLPRVERAGEAAIAREAAALRAKAVSRLQEIAAATPHAEPSPDRQAQP